MPGDPDRVAAWVEVLTGLTLDPKQGSIRVLDNPAWLAVRERLERLGGPPETGNCSASRRAIEPEYPHLGRRHRDGTERK